MVKGCWGKQIYKDLEDLDIHYSFSEIRNMTKVKFKSLVKEKVIMKVIAEPRDGKYTFCVLV